MRTEIIKTLKLRSTALEESRLTARADRLREQIAALKAELSQTRNDLELLRDQRAKDVRDLFFTHHVKQVDIAINAGKQQGHISNLIAGNTRCR